MLKLLLALAAAAALVLGGGCHSPATRPSGQYASLMENVSSLMKSDTERNKGLAQQNAQVQQLEQERATRQRLEEVRTSLQEASSQLLEMFSEDPSVRASLPLAIADVLNRKDPDDTLIKQFMEDARTSSWGPEAKALVRQLAATSTEVSHLSAKLRR